MDHAAELNRYLAGERVGDLGKVMRSLPRTIDAALATRAVVKLMERPFHLGRWCKRIPVPVIRKVLARAVPGPTHLFLRLAVPLDDDDEAIAARWTAALEALLDLDTTYAWGSKQRRAKFVALARDPVMLPAIQGTVASSKAVSRDLLAVLVVDGSDASYDALVTHIDAAFRGRDRRLDVLRDLQRHAKRTPALDALFTEVAEALEQRNASSPALALGPVIGIGEVAALAFSASVASARHTRNRVPWIQGSIAVDSEAPEWFHVSISTVEPTGRGKTTYFDAATLKRDELGLGRCTAAELPRWLASAAQHLEIEWAPHSIWHSNLRGKKRARVLAWLSGRP